MNSKVWIAIWIYVLVAVIRKRIDLKAGLYAILQILSAALFEKTPLEQVLGNPEYTMQERDVSNQLNLCDNLAGHY